MNSANKMHKGALPLSSVNKSHYGTKFFFLVVSLKKKGGGAAAAIPGISYSVLCSNRK